MIRKLPAVLSEVGDIFKEAGFQVFLVGGAVRNKLMGLIMSDFDLTTNAKPYEVQKLFRRVIPTGIQHGTVTVLYKKYEFEITTFRTESEYSNQRHPDKIEFSPDILEDLKRRDFTINSIALNLVTNEMIDPHNGKMDIKRKLIRSIGNPVDRFNEDGLRLMRAVRFMAQLQFDIEKNTLKGISTCSDNLKNVSSERIRDELIKILHSNHPSRALFLMEKTGLLNIFLPELLSCKGVMQKANHSFDVFEHSIYSCDGAPSDNLVLRLAALLHDIGKPISLKYDDDKMPTFHRHEFYSAKIAHKILKRLKFPIKIENDVCHLIENHMFNYQEDWTDSAVRRFLAKTGPENVDDVFSLRRADQFGMAGKPVDSQNLIDFGDHIKKVLSQEHILKIRDLDINGNDLFLMGGIPKGPQMGIILNFLLETVFDDPSLNTRDQLLKIAVSFYKTRLIDKDS
ncbi:MAG: HD domain-containing protein [Spirochaetales bacterium]|nr:HD domain-containing protein [Spirochaetales bacterium]